MLSLEVNGQFITWPGEFAFLMMKYYRKHGVNFVLHRNCAHAGRDTTAKNNSTAKKTGPFGAFEYSG
jgi:hypothetical protein